MRKKRDVLRSGPQGGREEYPQGKAAPGPDRCGATREQE